MQDFTNFIVSYYMMMRCTYPLYFDYVGMMLKSWIYSIGENSFEEKE